MMVFSWLWRLFKRPPKRVTGHVMMDARGSGPVQVFGESDQRPSLVGSRCKGKETHAPIIALSRDAAIIDSKKGMLQLNGEYLPAIFGRLCKALDQLGLLVEVPSSELQTATVPFRSCEAVVDPILRFRGPVSIKYGRWSGQRHRAPHLFVDLEIEAETFNRFVDAFQEAGLVPKTWPLNAVFDGMVAMYL